MKPAVRRTAMNPAWRVTASRPSYSMMLAAAAAARLRHVSLCSNCLHSSEVARGDICLLPEIST